MNTLTHDEIRDLAQHRDLPQVTIMLPLDPIAMRWRVGSLELKAALDDAKEQLVALGMRNPDVEDMLEPAKRHLDDMTFWKEAGRGLAIFLGPGIQRIFKVPVELPKLVEVSDEFNVKPLLPLVHDNRQFYVLAVGGNENRLLKCTRYTVERVPMPRAPKSLAEATRFVEEGKHSRQAHSAGNDYGSVAGHLSGVQGAPGGGPPMAGQGFGHEDRGKNEMMDYLRAIDRGLNEAIAGENAPLVFAGVERNMPIFQTANTYAHLVEEPITGNPELVSDDALRDQAFALVEPILRGQREQDKNRLCNQLDTELVSDDLEGLLKAANEGRIDTLFVDIDARLYGRYDDDLGNVEIRNDGQKKPGDEDLINHTTMDALLHGANVYAVRQEEMPVRGKPLNALLRW